MGLGRPGHTPSEALNEEANTEVVLPIAVTTKASNMDNSKVKVDVVDGICWGGRLQGCVPIGPLK